MHQKNVWRTAFVQWLPLAVTILILIGLVYAAVQQNYRTGANDPQVQISEDISTAVSQGATLASIVPADPTIDITASMQPFAAVYSATGTPIGSSVAVDGKLPTLPSGVFDYANKHGEDRFTWQPKSGVRIAAVIRKVSGSESGFILVGRSIKEVEKRENQLLVMSAIAAAAALILTFAVILLLTKFAGYGHRHEHETTAHSAKETPAGGHSHT